MLPFIFEVGIKKNFIIFLTLIKYFYLLMPQFNTFSFFKSKKNLTNLQFYRYFSSIPSNSSFEGPFETIGQEPDAMYTNDDTVSSIFGHVLETLQFNMFDNAYLDLVVVREEEEEEFDDEKEEPDVTLIEEPLSTLVEQLNPEWIIVTGSCIKMTFDPYPPLFDLKTLSFNKRLALDSYHLFNQSTAYYLLPNKKLNIYELLLLIENYAHFYCQKKRSKFNTPNGMCVDEYKYGDTMDIQNGVCYLRNINYNIIHNINKEG